MTDLAIATGFDRLTAQDRRLFSPFGIGPVAAPSHDRIHSAFEACARRTPTAIALVHGAEAVSYAELDRRANCLASLLKVHGVRAGDRVGLFLHRSVPMVVGILATLKIGAAYVPQDARITPTRHLGQILTTAGIGLVLTVAEHLSRIPRGKGHVAIAIDELALDALKYDGSIPLLTRTGQDTESAVVIFTSGTTGRPKGVAVTHAYLCNALLTEPDSLGIKPEVRVTQLVNIGFDMALWEVFGALSHGGTLVIRDRAIGKTVHGVGGKRRSDFPGRGGTQR